MAARMDFSDPSTMWACSPERKSPGKHALEGRGDDGFRESQELPQFPAQAVVDGRRVEDESRRLRAAQILPVGDGRLEAERGIASWEVLPAPKPPTEGEAWPPSHSVTKRSLRSLAAGALFQ